MKTLNLIFFCFLFNSVYSQIPNRPIPPNFPEYIFEVNQAAFKGHFISSVYKQGFNTNMYILDSLGYIAWYRTDQDNIFSSDFKYHKDQNLFSFYEYDFSAGPLFYTMDNQFNIVEIFGNVGDETIDTHDHIVVANGHKIIATKYDSIMDLRDYTFNDIPGKEHTIVRGNGLQEFDHNHNLIWTWRSTDFIHPEEFSDGLTFNFNDLDYAHFNSMQIDTDGNLIISFRNSSMVCKIDRMNRTGEIIWRLGGEKSSFKIEEADRFSAQHFARRLPNGNIGLFDNGNLRTPTPFSRAAEYQLNLIDSTATLVWTYDENKSIYSSATGSAQWLEDNLVLIGWGFVDNSKPDFTLVNKSDEVLTRLHYLNDFNSYRIQAYEFPFDLPRPHLTYEILNDSVLISAPFGYKKYIWSTGDTTQNIMVKNEGSYQVWVSHGIGMIGSYPLITDNLVATNSIDLSSEINIYPNPFNDYLSIDFSSLNTNISSFILFHNSGKKMIAISNPDVSSLQNLDTSSFTDGVYYLQIHLKDKIVTKKLLLINKEY